MSLTYIEAIGIGFPTVYCHAVGDASVYSNIVWDSGAPLPSQATLDSWISSNPNATLNATITKYQFRKLFTFAERVAIDAAPTNPAFSVSQQQMLTTMNNDMIVSGMVELNNPDTASGLNFLASLGLLTTARVTAILSNIPPA